MRSVVFAAVFAAFSASATAQPLDETPDADARAPLDRAALAAERPLAPPTIENVLGRDRQDLSGAWRYLIDPMRAGLRRGNSRRDFFRDRKAVPGGELIEYDWDASPEIGVPGDWNSQIEALRWYEGLLWYRRTFDAAPAEGRRRLLHFEGAGYRTHVFLNGAALGVHEGGFTPFEFDVTQALTDGRNSLVVAVDARHGSASVPGDYFDWKNYGGITRPVHLIDVPQTYVRDYRVDLSGDRQRINVRVLLDGPDRAGVKVSVDLAGRTATALADDDGAAVASLDAAGVALWSPASPVLHPLAVRAGDDHVEDRVGLRTIAVDGSALRLNDAPLFLRGISIHEERIGRDGGRWMDDAAVRRLLGEAKALNANFVRLAHYPHNERMVRIAEEMGLLVWSEIPVYWEVIDYANPETMALARATQAASIHRDYNRANVIVWSVANETPITPPRNAFLGVLVDDARALGGDRLISAALNKNRVEGDLITVDDPLGADLDLLAVNIYEGWYGARTLDEIANVRLASVYDKPLMFSEFGAGALRGHRGGADERWTEDYQEKYYVETLKLVEATPNVVGASPWVLKDFRSPRRWHGAYQQYWNRKGLIDENGARKAAFDVLADWYADKRSLIAAPE